MDRPAIKDAFALFSPFFLLVPCIAALLGIVLGMLDPLFGAGIIAALLITIVIIMRQDQLAAVLLIFAHLYVDWYLGFKGIALGVLLLLLALFYLTRSAQRPWVGPRLFWLWMLFLILGIYPALHGYTRSDGLEYYLNVVFAPFIASWLGALLARDSGSVRLFFQMLTALGALLALHTIIEAVTGILLFSSSRYDAYLAQIANYELAGTTVKRVGSFFSDPDWSGAFFAMMFFIPLGLFFGSVSALEKTLSLVAMALMFIALLFIFSNGSWLALFGGVVAFFLIAGTIRRRLLIFLLISAATGIAIVVFPTQIALELQHATGPTELVSRTSAWATAINVIRAHPLTGLGLGLLSYLNRAEPYRVIAQYLPLAHPHDAYLELAAMGGLPLLAAFLILLIGHVWSATRNWMLVDAQTRPLLAGGIAAIVALSINSISINGWTLAPIALLAWLILGMIASPLLTRVYESAHENAAGKEQG